MDTIELGSSAVRVSRLGYGCMRLIGDGSAAAQERALRAVHAAVDAGYTCFDHADIYGAGACEALFGRALRASPGLRDRLVLVSKCGIRPADDHGPKRYDFSAQHILASVDASLRRLDCDHLDVLLLHRPDYLGDADAVAEIFALLHERGKVRHFGLSNCSVSQFALYQSRVAQPLLVHQVEINLHNIDAFSNGVLDQCQGERVTPQAWCPLAAVAYPAWGNTLSAGDQQRLDDELAQQARVYACETWLIALAWLLAHPAKISPLIGSVTPARITAAVQALGLEYRREDWYRLLAARQGQAVP
ncbi:MAG: aldo/keto reductase [Planctomycetota bacterium]|jgi:predicted oxidoreductase